MRTWKHLASAWGLLGKVLPASLGLAQDRGSRLGVRWTGCLASAGIKPCAMLAVLAIAWSGAGEAAATERTPQAQEQPPAKQEQAVGTGQQPTEVERESWRKAILKIPRPKKACYEATYPETQWREVACKPPLRKLYPPKRPGTTRTQQVGNGPDFTAQVTGHISASEGQFDSLTGVTSEFAVPCTGAEFTCPTNPAYNAGTTNEYSLQLNTEPFTTETCNGSPHPKECQGFEQFVYPSSGGGSIQYWLENYGPGGTECPKPRGASCSPGFAESDGWCPFSFPSSPVVYCVVNAAGSTTASGEPATALRELKVTGDAAGVVGADDWITVTVGNTVSSSPGNNYFPDLGSQWKGAEFNVFGDGSGDQAVFNNGSTIVVQTSVDSGTNGAPMYGTVSFTGESNNLTLVCTPQLEPGTSTTLPSIEFAESNFDYLYSVPSPVNGKLVYLSASSDSNSAWGINAAGDVWRYSGGVGTKKNPPWQQVIPGKLQQISVGGEFVVWGVNSIGDIWKYVYQSGSPEKWELRMAHDKFPLPNTSWGGDLDHKRCGCGSLGWRGMGRHDGRDCILSGCSSRV